MKIYFLGTNGWYSSPTGDTPCVLIDSKDQYVIFDAGNGIYKIDKYITENKPILLFLTHFHIDHISGLHILGKFDFKQGIDIYFAKGRKKDFENFVNPPYTNGIIESKENILNLKTKVRLHELEEGEGMRKLFHGFDNHGFRITLEGKSVVYSGDTKIVPNELLLSKNADLLIHECSNIVSPKEDEWGHTDPVQAAQLAKNANVKKLVLTHFSPVAYDTLDKRKKAEKIARKIFANTIAAIDNLILTI
jgi:ribonuclease BN (tRNA processing enzyme)